MLDIAHYAVPTRHDELDHRDQASICTRDLSVLEDLDNQVGIDDLYNVDDL